MRLLAAAIALTTVTTLAAQDTEWPTPSLDARPGTRWWWMGSAVDADNLTLNLERYAKAGMGSVEITPIYGVQDNESRELSFLSPEWMQMLQHTESEAARLGMQVDMNTGTGWPFGGPEVTIDDAACKLFVNEYDMTGGQQVSLKVEYRDPKQAPYPKLERLMAFSDQGKTLDLTAQVKDGELTWQAPKGEWHLVAAFCGKTRQRVKRAAPGGEGYVLNHFSAEAVKRYLERFDRAFEQTATSMPHNFFNDSYEVYNADWTEGLFDEFLARRGYKLEEHLREFLNDSTRTDEGRRIVSDYRLTLAELLRTNFTDQWTAWAHSHGSLTRNQAHGSPANLIDLYAAVDVPECEGFGLSEFGIRGLRTDTIRKQNDADFSMLKYASSGAHISGKRLTSSETFTWLTEHFRTSLSQCKPDIDLMFTAGVNHAFFHGTTYSPADAAWPGWKFYASIDMSPTNTIWRDAPAFFSYITRCQSFLQMGQPDNDFLVYVPVYDMWHEQDGRLLMFDIHSMGRRAPRFIRAVDLIREAGYDMDYTSDSFLLTATVEKGQIVTSGGASYRALVIPGARLMPNEVLEKIEALAEQGATIVFLDQYPESVPGYSDLQKRNKAFAKSLKKIKAREGQGVIFGTDYAATLAQTNVTPEALISEHGLNIIRRSNSDGHHYFISALKPDDTEAWIPLAVSAKSAAIYNPMDGSKGKAQLRQTDGRSEIFLQLKSGESLIVKTFAEADIDLPAWQYVHQSKDASIDITAQKWAFRFIESTPVVSNAPDSITLGSWTDLEAENAKTNMGTALYSTTFTIDNPDNYADWLLTLGDVRESARVRINGNDVATLWAVPFECRVGSFLRKGENTIEIEVTNLPANRISQMDREGEKWRIFKDINIAALGYKKGDYAGWAPVESGLLGPVVLRPLDCIFNK